MSIDAAAPLSKGDEYDPRTVGLRLWRWIIRHSPSQGWATFVFLAATLVVVGESVTAPAWVDTPGLIAVLISGAMAGLLLAKVRAPAVLLHPVGLAIGFVMVVWLTSSLIEDQPLIQQVQELWSRVRAWYDAATSGGISTDLIPFSLGLLATGWVLGYLGAWFIFRSNNVWVAVVLSGTAILTNLSFLPDQFAFRFFVFTFFAMLLVVRMSIIQNHEAWRKALIQFSPSSGWRSIHAAIWLSIAVMLLAAVLPMKVVVSDQMTRIWEAARAPVGNLEDEFARLFSGIQSHKNLSGRFFGKTLPFLGDLSFGGEAVMWADTEYPSYWVTQTYSEYTSKGWVAGDTVNIKVGPDILPPPRSDTLKRELVNQALRVDFSTSDFLSGGRVDWVSRDVYVQALAPKEFAIDLRDSSQDVALPEDIRRLAVGLREKLDSPPAEFLESYISKVLPPDMVLISTTLAPEEQTKGILIGPDTQPPLESVTVARKEPISPTIVSWKLADAVPADGGYSMVSSVSVATDDDLRAADRDYSGFMRDHYLQLPADLPQRVRALAERLTEGAVTPLDKALAIQSHLRESEFAYSRIIGAPPAEEDAVDQFLFETKKGYSDYFASAMAVMLRAVGVPTRLAGGYAPGQYVDEQDLTVVRDSDSHLWPQVYFPRYGWIDFEPTPNWAVHDRGLLSEVVSDFASSGPGSLDPFDDEDELEELMAAGLGGSGIEGSAQVDSPWDPSSLVVPIAIAAGALTAAFLVLRVAWNAGLSKAAAVEKAYTKMSRLGALAGIKRRAHQTPAEYAGAIRNAIPGVGSWAQRIAWGFASGRYGRRELPEKEQEELDEAWKRMRGKLYARAFLRLIPTRGGARQ